VKDGCVVKGVRFAAHRTCGDPLELAQRYCDEGADEIVIYDITASPAGRTLDGRWLRRIARDLDVPLCVAGGIRTVEQAMAILEAGADKISINSPALERPSLIDDLVRIAGSQCVVVGIDSTAVDGAWIVSQYTGDPSSSRRTRRRTLDWAIEVQERGAGEIVLNCMDNDGVRSGYDVEQLAQVRRGLSIPLIASGGAGNVDHFKRAFLEADVSGALAASVFHSGAVSIQDVKRELIAAGMEVRS